MNKSNNTSPQKMPRRDFLAASAVATTAVASTTVNAKQADGKLVVGVMGMQRGRSLVDTFAKHADVVVKYVCDVDSQRAASAAKLVQGAVGYTPQAITKWEDIIADDEIDILVCAAPNHWHAPATIVAAEAGKHVYVEKPCCQNPWEGEQQIAAARKNNVCVQIGTQRRSSPAIIEGMEFIHSGGIGKVHAVNCYYFSQRGSIGTGKPAEVPAHIDYERWQGPAPRQPYVDNRVHYNWHWFWHYGNGELGNNGIHTLDMARWALQAEFPTRVTSTGDRYYFDDDQQTPDTNTVSYEFGDKGHVTWFGNSCNRNGSGFVTVYGDKGSIEFHSAGGYTVKDGSNKEVKTASSGQGQPEHVDNLIQSIQAGDWSKLNAEIEIGHRSTLLCHLGNIAHRVGRVVDCDTKTGRVLGDKEAAALWKREYHEGWEERLTIS